MNLRDYIRDIPDFPQKGILFRDLTPLLGDADAFESAIEQLKSVFVHEKIDKIVGVEARGFIVGAALAYALHVGFVPARKPGKLPFRSIRKEYELEYGVSILEMHEDAIKPGERVLIVDDLLATGGTVSATADLVRSLGGEIVAYAFLVTLVDLGGGAKLGGGRIVSLLDL
ncbi:MAG: adenine phosphoribosyltransferase [Caldisericota bacterium]|nr:adenine phosphoribosyltransferase [Caldisericota bacterium]